MFTAKVLLICTLVYLVVLLANVTKIQLRRRRIIRERGCRPPPGSSQLGPFFGLDVVIQVLASFRGRRRNLASLKAQVDQYGRTFQSHVLATTRIFTIEPRNLQSIFSTDFDSWGVQPLRLSCFGPFVGKGIMTTDGSFWEHSRALMRPTFARSQVANLAAYDVLVERLIKLIPKDGIDTDLQPLFARLALDSSTTFLFGHSAASLTESWTADDDAFLRAYNYGQAYVGKIMLLPPWKLLTMDKRFSRSCAVARKFVDKYIAEALDSKRVPDPNKTKRLVLAQELAKQTGDRDDIRNQLLNVFLPAHDATSVALTNIFFHLARHPAVYSKLRHEVLAAGEAAFTFEGLKSLKYLQQVMNETFRLNPSIGQMARIALRDTVLPTGGGTDGMSPVFVKKGSIAVTSFYALHRLPDLFGTDAHLFRPERWQTLKPVHWSYLPFSGGPRLCIGQQLALTEVAYTTAKLVQRFERIENADPVLEFVEQWKLVTESRNGAKVRLFQGHGSIHE